MGSPDIAQSQNKEWSILFGGRNKKQENVSNDLTHLRKAFPRTELPSC